jgi:sugar O-acyltransferase (sialic acid O-acetyltransferase NeuD family)
MDREIIIIGTGAQAKYALEIFKLTSQPVRGIIALPGKTEIEEFDGVPVLGGISEFEGRIIQNNSLLILLAFRNNALKAEFVKRFAPFNPKYLNAVHPSAIIATTAILGAGIILNANAVIQPYAYVGNHTMIHAGVIVEHDCIVGDFVNLAPRAILTGHVKVGRCSTIYSGAVVAPTVEIGRDCIVGAGSVVLENVKDGKTVVGIPACERQ